MFWNTEYPLQPLLLLAAFLVSTIVTFLPSYTVLPLGTGDGTLLALQALHFVWALQFGIRGVMGRRGDAEDTHRAAEGLFFFGVFLFLFAYVYASNANMDYVQRYIAGGGAIQLAPDTRTERLLVAGRYGPFLLVDLILWTGAIRRLRRERVDREWVFAPLLMIASVALSVLANPSFVDVEGYGWLGWISFVPLFYLLRREVESRRFGRAIWYGVLYGVLFTLVGNYWLGTFNLISLQAVGVIFLAFYLLYMPIAVGALSAVSSRSARGSVLTSVARVLVLPLSWTVFELARSSGFLGYPWLLVAHSQYRFPAMIQLAGFGGVWLVSFVVLLVNAFLAEAWVAFSRKKYNPAVRNWVVAALVVFLLNGAYGWMRLGVDRRSTETVRVALIQQNNDPRKHEYRETFDTLQELTNKALSSAPDLVVWSETAFVPNIRRWSQEDPRRYNLAGLVGDLLDYLATVDTWLLTGNDDYRRVLDDDGDETERNNYNAAVLFSDDDRRIETYHKVKLVPFTEHFPYRQQLPWVYDLLMSVDITFWTPGEEFVVFTHPDFQFATPICFEDVFPGIVRQFALSGMEVIVNITNDYWSLREQAAQQHFAAAMFRSIELGMPMVRATASGVTGHIDDRGRIVATIPQYTEGFLVAEVDLVDGDDTLYHRWGDWIPITAGAVLAVIVLALVILFDRTGKRRE